MIQSASIVLLSYVATIGLQHRMTDSRSNFTIQFQKDILLSILGTTLNDAQHMYGQSCMLHRNETWSIKQKTRKQKHHLEGNVTPAGYSNTYGRMLIM